MEWNLRPSTPADVEWIAELKADVLGDDLRRLGRYDDVRVRQRLRDEFAAARTRVIVVGGADAGSIAVRPTDDSRWIEHFYLARDHQGLGIGGAVLRAVLAEPDPEPGPGPDPRPFRIDVLQGSAARRLYERHGFVLEREDAIDAFLVRPAAARPVISRVGDDDAGFRALVAAQEAEVRERYATEVTGPGIAPGTPALVAYVDGDPVGCVAVGRLDATTGEVKRLFVAAEARGLGLSRALMARVEALAAEVGYSALRLETGSKQPEAVRLYETSGWRRIPNYGYFRDDPEVISMEKPLAG
ncbi:GNAT family N-acetyltransferase [Agromyces sp. MMS24-K17]|uniref:GNAT family N-acetyltransferase n=1 Tax=Agromyces sp. MMS24-K17 TaxID=3372850 RepID=UPI00375428B6